MRAIERILEQLNQAWEGEAWHGPALRTLLDGVSEEQSRAHPIPGAHSILEIVVHCGIWMDVVSHRLAGNSLELTTEEDWPLVASKHFSDAVEELTNAESRLCDAVARLRTADLDQRVAGRNDTVYTTVHGVIQHNLYHAGQIALLRKLPLRELRN